jgi:amino acid transporter
MNRILALNIEESFEPAKKFNNIGSVVNLIVTNIFLIAGLILFIGIVMGGFTLMTKGSNPEEMHKGQQMLTYSAIGFVLIIVSYFVVRIVLQILGVDNTLLDVNK